MNPDPYAAATLLVVGARQLRRGIAHDSPPRRKALAALGAHAAAIVRRATAASRQLLEWRSEHAAPLVDPITKGPAELSDPDLSAQGMPPGPSTACDVLHHDRTTPILDVGIVDAVKTRTGGGGAAVDGFDGDDVLLADGSRIAP